LPAIIRVIRRRQPPPHLYFAVSAVFHYLGPSFAVLLFARVPVLGVAWLRVASAAAVFALWRRPWRALRRPLVIGWGLTLALMNCCFYEAIHRLPLGTVAAIEFVPVIALAALGARSVRNLMALTLAVGGVALLSDVQLADAPLGFAFAAANAILFGIYIVLAHRAARDPAMSGLTGLGAAMLIALVAVTPVGGPAVLGVLGDPVALLAGVGVGLCSSVIPYVADQLAMAHLSRANYALMVALLPAMAVLVGVLVLAQLPSPTDVLAIGLVVAGVAVHREAGGAQDCCVAASPAAGSASASPAAGAASASPAAGCGAGSTTGSGAGAAAATARAPAAPMMPSARASAAHLDPCFSIPRAESTEGEPGPVSASASTAAISTALYS
jgi:inner membrane transporter RhtA